MNDTLPVDLDALAAQTGGDRALGREVLALFVRDAPQQAEHLRLAAPGQRAALAHRLVGSARAIGAHELARCAAEVERGRGDVGEVAAATARAVAFVSAHLAAESA